VCVRERERERERERGRVHRKRKVIDPRLKLSKNSQKAVSQYVYLIKSLCACVSNVFMCS